MRVVEDTIEETEKMSEMNIAVGMTEETNDLPV